MQPDDVFAGPWRLRTTVSRRGFLAWHSASGAAGLGCWIVAGNIFGIRLSRRRFRLFIRNRAVRRTVRLADDLRDALVLPEEMGLRAPAPPAGAYDRLSIHFARGRCFDHRNPFNYIVGGSHSRNADCRSALAGSADSGIFPGPPTALDV